MTTLYGVNPSFNRWTNPRPLMRNLVRNGKAFEVLDVAGRPTGELSVVDPDTGLPVSDGRLHGVRILSGPSPVGELKAEGVDIVVAPSGMTVAASTEWTPESGVFGEARRSPMVGDMGACGARVVRTLDLQRTNDRGTGFRDPQAFLQGTAEGVAVPFQAMLATNVGAHLWWTCPPSYGDPQWEGKVRQALGDIRLVSRAPIVLEYGNELWNADFPVHDWLRRAGSRSWVYQAADEIARLRTIAVEVLGEYTALSRPFYLFVGGHTAQPSVLDNVLYALHRLGVTPDIAGPALYVGPLRESREEWKATGTTPTQDELAESCRRRLVELEHLLEAHSSVLRTYRVPLLGVYEAGVQGLCGTAPWRSAWIQAHQEEWMADLYRGIRRIASDVGVNVLNWYSASTDQAPPPGVEPFGLRGYPGEFEPPKFRAALGDS